MRRLGFLSAILVTGVLLSGDIGTAESLPAIAIEPGAATRSPNYDHGGYSLARSPGKQITSYYFGDYGYYGYPWGYYFDVGTLHPQYYYTDRGYPYNNGSYFWGSNPHSGTLQRRLMPSHGRLQ